MNPIGPFADRSPPTPNVGEGGAIPGLRGAPVRTPVRSSGVTTGPALWPAVAGRYDRLAAGLVGVDSRTSP